MRLGEWMAAVGSVGLLVVLFLDWFALDLPAGMHVLGSARTTGWASLGWFMDLLLALVIFGGLSITYMTLRRTSPAWPVGASVLTTVVGWLVLLILLVRVITQPSLGADGLPNDLVTIQLPAYLGLLLAALIPAGAWQVLRDERVDAPESAYTPPPARAVPGA